MKIETSMAEGKYFEELLPGDVFWYEELYYMKTTDSDETNAVILDSGITALFCRGERVMPINAKLIIEQKGD